MRGFIDMSGKVCGDLLVHEYCGKNQRSSVWRCECLVCGAITYRDGMSLRRGKGTRHRRKCASGGIGSQPKEQLCWSCKNAVGFCPWSEDFTPIDGWTAKPTMLTHYSAPQKPQFTPSYEITACPLYEKDEEKRREKRD